MGRNRIYHTEEEIKANQRERFAKWYVNNKEKQQAWVKEHAKKHPESVKRSTFKNNKKQRIKLNSKKAHFVKLKGGKCSSCNGVFELCCYDFHHINPKEKDRALTNFWSKSISYITKELNNCILLCSNCHRLIHYKYKDFKEIKIIKNKQLELSIIKDIS